MSIIGNPLILGRVSGNNSGSDFDGTGAVLIVEVSLNAVVTATKNGVILTPTVWTKDENSAVDCAIFFMPSGSFDSETPWTVVAESGANTISGTIVIDSAKEYEMSLIVYTGALYNHGIYSAVPHQFTIYNGAIVTDASDYINVSLNGNAQREGGVRFGPVILGSTYTFVCENANSSNVMFAGGADRQIRTRINYQSDDRPELLSEEQNVSSKARATFAVDTSSLRGESGYIYVSAYFDYAWANARTNNRILSVIAS